MTSPPSLVLASWAFVSVFAVEGWSAETYGNFHTMGIVLDVPGGLVPAKIKRVNLSMLGGDRPRRLLDPVQVGENSYFATSVFDLQPDTQYKFRVEFVGNGEDVLHREEFSGRTRAEPGALPIAFKEIHVATIGDDANPGTLSRPKRTIKAALRIANRPGTHVVIHEGIYHEGGLPAVGNGTSAAPIVVRGAKGESVVIDGTDTISLAADWNDLGDGFYSTPYEGKTWLAAVRHQETGTVRRFYPVGSLANLRAKKVGGHDFETYQIGEAYYCTGKEIFIYCPYHNPHEMKFHVAHHQSVVEHSSSRYVVYSDLTFRFFQGQAFYINNSSDITFRRCNFEYCTLPIAVKRASHRLLVEECRFVDDCTRWGFLPKGLDDVGYSAHIELGCVYVHAPYEGRGMVIRNNVIDGLFDGVHLAPSGPPPKVRTHETDFYHNHLVKVCDDLIEADGQCLNLRIFSNRMANFLSGISIAQGCQGPTYVAYNELIGAGNTSATRLPPNYEGYPVKTNGGREHGLTGWAFFFHNTCHTTVPQTNAFRVQDARWRKLILSNNIWHGTRDGFVFWRKDISPLTLSNDWLHVESGVPLKIGKATYASQPRAAKRLPTFAQVIVDDPKLRDPGNGDFRLRTDSPAIDAGIVIPGINDQRMFGKAPDVGAHESRPLRSN